MVWAGAVSLIQIEAYDPAGRYGMQGFGHRSEAGNFGMAGVGECC